jgi:Na+/citrate or Na+/malate symporter
VRFLHIYLTLYFLLLAGAMVVLWDAGILGRLPAVWVGAALAVAILVGVLLGAVSRRPPARRTPAKRAHRRTRTERPV